MKRFLTLFAAMSTMTIMFTATLANSETGKAFAALLPLTVTMNELNGNEKYHYLVPLFPPLHTNPAQSTLAI